MTNEQLNTKVFGFEFNLRLILWFLAVKLQLIILLFIWHYTSRHWWKIAIMIPLTLEVFKFIGFLNIKFENFDEVDFITSIPVTIPIVLSLLYLSNKLNKYINHQVVYEKLNTEIDLVFKEMHYNNNDELILKLEFSNLKKNKKNFDKAEYLEKLLKLRSKLYQNEKH
ncbi:hypothetical protein [Psychroserpens algicola]|uniref:hypothetical protein n=1 Tax=Psychroserpens algicola TaxID=1719034 RepID=UPI0019543C53|nr:hypothetical protein [Psychroserpens algicola]